MVGWRQSCLFDDRCGFGRLYKRDESFDSESQNPGKQKQKQKQVPLSGIGHESLGVGQRTGWAISRGQRFGLM
jgi:hypothetical protein